LDIETVQINKLPRLESTKAWPQGAERWIRIHQASLTNPLCLWFIETSLGLTVYSIAVRTLTSHSNFRKYGVHINGMYWFRRNVKRCIPNHRLTIFVAIKWCSFLEVETGFQI